MPFQECSVQDPAVRMMFRQSLMLTKQSVRGMGACTSDMMCDFDEPTLLMLMQISMASLASDGNVAIFHTEDL